MSDRIAEVLENNTRRGYRRGAHWGVWIYSLLLVGVAMAVGLYRVSSSGPQWLEDAPRYANAGAMMYDWLASGEWFSPVEFARKNYQQFPFCSVPYHPPGYPFLLGAWFYLCGMSYLTARIFIALCLAVCSLFFFGILRRQGLSLCEGFALSVMFLSTPEIVCWSRCTMSEIPSLLFIMGGTYYFLRWTEEERGCWLYSAFCLAFMAFFCRVLSIGIIPAWFLFLLAKKDYRRLFSIRLIISSGIFLAIAVAWTRFVALYARYEIRKSVSQSLTTFLTSDNLMVWLRNLPEIVGWLGLAAALVGLAGALGKKSVRLAGFWILWFICCYSFIVLQAIHFESRYFTYVVPAVCALAGGIFSLRTPPPRAVTTVQWLLIASAITVNCFGVARFNPGFTGYQAVAEYVSRLEEPGNVLLCSWFSTDFVFRYRSQEQKSTRAMIRGDRTLAIRAPQYANVPVQMVALSTDDVVRTIRRGRVRYLLTTPLSDMAEFRLAHATALSRPGEFTLLKKFDLVLKSRDMGAVQVNKEVYVWRFNGDLPPGKSDLPVVVPTASMTIQP